MQPPASLPPDLSPEESECINRYLRVFGPRKLPEYLAHLKRLKTPKPWFVCLDLKGAKYFTHFVRLAKPVKNARSITGSQKFIAKNADNFGVIF